MLLLLIYRRPSAANKQLVFRLSAEQKASLAAAAEQAELFASNPTTNAIQDSLAAAVLEAGSLAGMLQQKAGPLLHSGYALPPFQAKIDLAWLNMTPASARAYSDGLLGRINAANSTLFGPLPPAPQRPVLLQTMVDLWCSDWDMVKLTFANPAVQEWAATTAASAAVLSSLASAVQVAQAVARGDTHTADKAAADASRSAAASHLQQLQAIAAEDDGAGSAALGAPAALALQARCGSGGQAEPASMGTGVSPSPAAARVPVSSAGVLVCCLNSSRRGLSCC